MKKNGNFYLKVYNPFITGLMNKEICGLINSPYIDHQEVPFQSACSIDASQTQIVEESLIILFRNLDHFTGRLALIKLDAFEFVVGNFLDGFIDFINNMPKKLKYFDIDIQVLLTINIFSIFKFKKFKYIEEMENVYFNVDKKDCTSNFIEIMLQDIDHNIVRSYKLIILKNYRCPFEYSIELYENYDNQDLANHRLYEIERIGTNNAASIIDYDRMINLMVSDFTNQLFG